MQNIFKQLHGEKGVLYSWYEAMHTRIDLIICNKTKEESILITQLIKKEIQRIEKVSNRFDETSELFNLNQTAHIKPVSVSDELYSILSDCCDLHVQTCQCFDITIQSVPQLTNRMGKLIMDDIQKTVYFTRKGISLDLCGYIKGYVLDCIRKILETNHISDALINLGNSSILAIGNQPLGQGWKIELGSPNFSTTIDKSIILKNETLTTSGNKRAKQRHIKHHITNQWITGIREVSVVTSTGKEGEALSTALFVATEQERLKILANFSFPYFIVK